KNRALVPVAAMVACFLLSWWWQIAPAIRAYRTDRDMRSELGFMSLRVGPDDVVMTDLDTGWGVPAFAGEIVACRHPVAFVRDHDARLRDVARFFDPAAPAAERAEIIARRGVRFVLIDAQAKGMSGVEVALRALGSTVVEKGRFRLVAL